MLFQSFSFIFVFLPASLLVWFGLNRLGYEAPAKFALILLSLVFYGMFSVWNVPVILVSAAVNYAVGSALDRIPEEKKGSARALLVLGVVFNLVYLGAFKYASSYEGLLKSALSLPEDFSILLPVGISFYTFSQISYVVDRYRGEAGDDSFLNYLLVVTFYPKLAEGPITRYEEIGPQFHDEKRKKFQPENFTRGLMLFFLGMAKKVLIADRIAPAATFGFSNAYYMDTLTVIAFMAAYMFQLYFDFSGYIDMASGIAKMFNIDLPLNFDSPFQARNFSSFWKKWHMSLTRFFTRYVYIPLGGSRDGKLHTAVNVVVVFVLSGLWHGTGWTYLYWGVLSGVLVVLSNLFFRKASEKAEGKIRVFLCRLLTTVLFAFTLLFFGADRIEISFVLLRRLFYPTWPGFLYRMANTLDIPEFYVLNEAVSHLWPEYADLVKLQEFLFLLALCIILVSGRNAREIAEKTPLKKRYAFLFGILAAWCLCSLQGVRTFLYFKF